MSLGSYFTDNLIELLNRQLKTAFELNLTHHEWIAIVASLEHMLDEFFESKLQSRLNNVFPDTLTGELFTKLPLVRAFKDYDRKAHITKRQYVAPTFNEVRHILNTSQIMAIAGTIKLITFDGDETLYCDGKCFSDETLASYITSLLKDGVKIGLVTAAGYEYQTEKYEARLEGLFDYFRAQKVEPLALENFFVMGGECNYFMQLDGNSCRLKPVPRIQWVRDVDEPDVNEQVRMLDLAESILRQTVDECKLNATVHRKKLATGITAGKKKNGSTMKLTKEILDEICIRVKKALRMANVKVHYCAFNGGSDVWVDCGNKRVGLERMRFFFNNLKPSECMHVGDQFYKTGNDFQARSCCTCLWINGPEETKSCLKKLLRERAGIANKASSIPDLTAIGHYWSDEIKSGYSLAANSCISFSSSDDSDSNEIHTADSNSCIMVTDKRNNRLHHFPSEENQTYSLPFSTNSTVLDQPKSILKEASPALTSPRVLPPSSQQTYSSASLQKSRSIHVNTSVSRDIAIVNQNPLKNNIDSNNNMNNRSASLQSPKRVSGAAQHPAASFDRAFRSHQHTSDARRVQQQMQGSPLLLDSMKDDEEKSNTKVVDGIEKDRIDHFRRVIVGGAAIFTTDVFNSCMRFASIISPLVAPLFAAQNLGEGNLHSYPSPDFLNEFATLLERDLTIVNKVLQLCDSKVQAHIHDHSVAINGSRTTADEKKAFSKDETEDTQVRAAPVAQLDYQIAFCEAFRSPIRVSKVSGQVYFFDGKFKDYSKDLVLLSYEPVIIRKQIGKNNIGVNASVSNAFAAHMSIKLLTCVCRILVKLFNVELPIAKNLTIESPSSDISHPEVLIANTLRNTTVGVSSSAVFDSLEFTSLSDLNEDKALEDIVVHKSLLKTTKTYLKLDMQRTHDGSCVDAFITLLDFE